MKLQILGDSELIAERETDSFQARCMGCASAETRVTVNFREHRAESPVAFVVTLAVVCSDCGHMEFLERLKVKK